MLSSLRTGVARSAPRQARSISAQVEANQSEMFSIFGTFAAAKNPPPAFKPPVERRLKDLTTRDIPPAQDPLLEFITSRFMIHGHRARAAKSTSEILLHICALTRAAPLPILRQAVELASPAVRVMRHKTGGKVVMKPVALNERQRTKRGIDRILESSALRPERTRAQRVARECIRVIQDASKDKVDGGVMAKKEEIHKLAMTSRGNLPRM